MIALQLLLNNKDTSKIQSDDPLSQKMVNQIVELFRDKKYRQVYNICKKFKPLSQNLKYSITDSNGKILNNSSNLENLILKTNWKKIK